MGTRVLYDPTERAAVLYDSVTGYAFGPIIEGESHEDPEEIANLFLDWLHADGHDPLTLGSDVLGTLLNRYRAAHLPHARVTRVGGQWPK